jgi:surfactin synthase thioesterase subunit
MKVALYLREHHRKQPDLMFMVHAHGPQAFEDGQGFEEEEDEEGGFADRSNEEEEEEMPLWEEDDGELYEHVMTLERGGIHEEADNPGLFKYGLPSFKADLQALQSFSYKSDWPIARPLYLIIAHYDGRLSREKMRTWEKETTKQLIVHEMLCDVRSMLREDKVIIEFGQWLHERIVEEIQRVKDPDEDQLDEMARGVKT